MADFIKCILVIFEWGIFHAVESRTTANRYLNLHENCPVIPINKFINNTSWPANYISEIERVGTCNKFPVVCLPLVKGIDEVVKMLACDGYNISIISPKYESTYFKCATEDVVMSGRRKYSKGYEEQRQLYHSMFEEATDVTNKLKADTALANSNNVKFIELDHSLAKMFGDLSKMESHNNVYITSNYKYASLMTYFYPSSSFYTLPKQYQNNFDPMVKIIDGYMSEKNDRAVIIYNEEGNLTLNLEMYYNRLARFKGQVIPLFRLI